MNLQTSLSDSLATSLNICCYKVITKLHSVAYGEASFNNVKKLLFSLSSAVLAPPTICALASLLLSQLSAREVGQP